MVQALGKLLGSQGGDGIDLLGGGGEGDLVPGRWLQAILVCFHRMANRYLIALDTIMFRKERRTFGHLMSWADEFLGDDERRENIKVSQLDSQG